MRARFGRRRSRGSRESALDPGVWSRLATEGTGELPTLEPRATAGVPDSFALTAAGRAEDGTAVIAAFAREGDRALLAGLAAAADATPEEPFTGRLVAVAPTWSAGARRRLGLVGQVPFAVQALAAPFLGSPEVSPEIVGPLLGLDPERIAAQLKSAADRALFLRAAASLEGLSAKHEGGLRGVGSSLELVVAARRVAVLRADESGVLLDVLEPRRSTVRLGSEGLTDALDRLEGAVRKRLGDRRVRDGEDGFRWRALAAVCEIGGLRALQRWPVGGKGDEETLDLAAVDTDGVPVLGALRPEITLPALAGFLESFDRAREILPNLLHDAEPPVHLAAPRIVLGAQRFDPVVSRVLAFLALPNQLVEVHASGRQLEAAPLSSESAAEAPRYERRPRGRRRGRGQRGDSHGRDASPERQRESPASPEREEGSGEADSPRYLEVSLFDLADDPHARPGNDEDDGNRRRGRSRRGGRRRRRGGGRQEGEHGGGPEEDVGEEASPDALAEEVGRGGSRGRRRRGGRHQREAELTSRETDRVSTDDEVELPDDLAPLSEAPDELETGPVVAYDDEDETDDGDSEEDRIRLEREARRRARVAKMEPAPEPPPEKKRPRRRAAILAHADRDSLFAAVLLARDVRLLEGIWVYPQDELMTFFRSVATDLREDAPIYIIGFTPSPAHTTIQAASLYAERLVWFDHHVWAPEDLEAMKSAIGEDSIFLTPGTNASLPAVLSECTRRSRFSDKLVDLATARFTLHDFVRWGRLWRHRLAEMVSQPGEHRSALEPLLVGRPSDLAKEAAQAPVPPLPPEAAFAASRDFRLVHFAGYVMAVLEVPPSIDPHLAARIVRERYGADLSLTFLEGEELGTLAAEDFQSKRALDLSAMVEHLAAKFDDVIALSDEDHVARFRVRGRADEPSRIEEVVAEIAMGRGLLEG